MILKPLEKNGSLLSLFTHSFAFPIVLSSFFMCQESCFINWRTVLATLEGYVCKWQILLVFPLPAMSLFSLNSWKIILSDTKYMVESSLFSAWKFFCYFLWPMWFQMRKLPFEFVCPASYLCSCFQDFCFLVFRYVCQVVIPVGLPVCGLLSLICGFTPFSRFGSFQPFVEYSSLYSFSSLHGTLMIQI